MPDFIIVDGPADGVAGSERVVLDRDLDAVEGARRRRRCDDDERVGRELARGRKHPVDHTPAEQGVQVLRYL